MKWKLGNGKCLGSTVLRTLNAGHNQLVKRLNKGYPKLQAQIQSKLDKDKREETGEVTTVLEYVLVAGVSNCNSVTKKECIMQMKKLMNVKDDANKNECSPSF